MDARRRRIPDWEKRRIVDDQDYQCARCRGRIGWSYQIDHIQPLHLGGDNSRANLQALCGTCHNEKTLEETAAVEQPATVAACGGCGKRFSRYFGHTCPPLGAAGEESLDAAVVRGNKI